MGTHPIFRPVSIIPIVPPVIEASIKNSTVTISWQPHDHIHEFRLERAKYLEDKKKWGSWEIIKTSLAKNSTSTTDSISSDGTYRYRLSIDNGKYKGTVTYQIPWQGFWLLQTFNASP